MTESGSTAMNAGAPAGRPDPDDWRQVQNTAGANRGGVGTWVACMLLLLGGFVLLGTGYTDGNGVVFSAGILVCTLAFLVPMGLRGYRER